MINLDDVTKEDTKEHNRNWSQRSDHSCRILTTGKINRLFNLISHQLDIDIICAYA